MYSKFLLGAIGASLIACSASASAQTMTSGFGTRTDPIDGGKASHAGVDIAARKGTPVYATADAVVSRSEVAGGYGNLVELDHGGGYKTRFAHLSKRKVAEGQRVRRGQLIGLIGSTGRSTGPHLHYEVRVNGRAVDPTPYIRGAAGHSPQVAVQRYRIADGHAAMGGPNGDR